MPLFKFYFRKCYISGRSNSMLFFLLAGGGDGDLISCLVVFLICLWGFFFTGTEIHRFSGTKWGCHSQRQGWLRLSPNQEVEVILSFATRQNGEPRDETKRGGEGNNPCGLTAPNCLTEETEKSPSRNALLHCLTFPETISSLEHILCLSALLDSFAVPFCCLQITTKEENLE